MKNLKIIINVTLVQIIVWAIFTLKDWISENLYVSSNGIDIITPIILAIIITIIYCKNENKYCKKLEISERKFNIIVFICWTLETVIIGNFICNLVNYNKWIVDQRPYFLNGLEYFVLAYALGILPILIVIIKKLIIFIYKKIKKNR